MSVRVLSPLNLVNVATDPAGEEGDFIYNTTDKVPKFCDGAGWQAMGAAAGVNLDGGTPTSNYGGTTAMDGGSA